MKHTFSRLARMQHDRVQSHMEQSHNSSLCGVSDGVQPEASAMSTTPGSDSKFEKDGKEGEGSSSRETRSVMCWKCRYCRRPAYVRRMLPRWTEELA